MLQTVAAHIGSKVLTALLVLGCLGAGIYFWRNPDDLRAIWQVIKYVLSWLAFVAVLPWATFFVTRWVMNMDSNWAEALMLIGYLALDIAMAMFLAGFSGHGFLAWSIMIVGFLTAAVYNFLVCNYLSDRFEEA